MNLKRQDAILFAYIKLHIFSLMGTQEKEQYYVLDLEAFRKLLKIFFPQGIISMLQGNSQKSIVTLKKAGS